MSSDTAVSGGSEQLDIAPVETALAVLCQACHEAISELGGTVPGVQLRALLIIDEAGGSLDLHQLAAGLTTSVPATSRVRDRMQAAGLLAPGGSASSPAAQSCVLTCSGDRLARWVRNRQRTAVSEVLDSMPPQARDALVHGLRELAAAAPRPS